MDVEISNGCLFSRSAYFYGVLIKACNFLVPCSCVGNRLAVIYFTPTGSFSVVLSNINFVNTVSD